ncbi:MAG: hypothetical protein OSA92_13880 [Pirellulaceae bacterium]|nr:hypothetical protein [Pirellulaceae bacterium]
MAVLMVGCNTEVPNTEVPNTEVPNTEAPNTEAPNTEAPNTEASNTEASNTEASNTEAPGTEAPGTLNIQDIITEHIEAVGGAKAIRKIQTVRKFHAVNTTAPTGNATGTVMDTFDLIADRGRVDMDLGVFQESKGWTGQQGWKKNSFEPLRDITAEELPIEKMGVNVSPIFTLNQAFGSAAFLPATKSKFNDHDCVKVEIVDSPLALYLNEKTKLIEGMVIPNLIRITFSNYKLVTGVQVPFRNKVEIFPTSTTITTELKRVEFNGELDADIFTKPAN